MMTIFAEASMIRRVTSCWIGVRLGEHRMKGRDNGHLEARIGDQRYRRRPARRKFRIRVEGRQRRNLNCSKARHPEHIRRSPLRESESYRRRIIIATTGVRHGDDAGFQIGASSRSPDEDHGKGSDSAATRKVIANECNALELTH